MKKSFIVLGLFVFLAGFFPISTQAALPTSWTPKINLSSSQRAVWAQMKADYDANPGAPSTVGGKMYSRLKTNAECKCRYADTGLMAATLYQITNDPTYASLSFQAVTSQFLGMTGKSLAGNHAREYFIEYVTIFDWIYPALTPAQRQQFFDKINEMAVEATTNPYAVNAPIRSSDSDAVVGEYLGLSLWYLLTQSYNPTIVNIYAMPFIGGLNPTGTSISTLRNSVKFYVEVMAKGGEWIESSEYNIGTESLLLTGTQAIKSLTGVDYFPEVTAFIPDLAKRQLLYTTNDLNQSIQWGDEQDPRQYQGRLFYHNRLNAMLAGLTKGTAVGQQLQDLVLDLMQKYPPQGDLDNALAQRWIYFFDPYAPRGDRTTAIMKHYAEGMGTLFHHDGRGNDDSIFWAQTPQGNFVDHMPWYLGDFQLYRKGEWALTHPLAYGGVTVSGQGGVNGMVIGGIPFITAHFDQAHDALEQEFGQAGSQEYSYLASAEGGQVQFNGSYQAPPTFLHEHSRSILYLPSASKNVDTIVVHDRVNAEDPKAFAGFPGGYAANISAQISRESNNKDWYIHMPVVPIITPSTISWSTARNSMKVSMLLPTNKTATVINQTTDWGPGTDGAAVQASEKKYSVRISPTSFRQFETFLNVVQAGNPGVSTSNTLVKSTNGEAEGVVIARPGQNDVVALFNARQSNNLPKLNNKDNPYNPAVTPLVQKAHFTNLGYTATFSVSTPTSEVLIADLDPTATWYITTDGGSERSFSVNSKGLGKVTLSGAGSHALTLRGTGGNIPAPVIPPAPIPTPIPVPTPTPTPIPNSTKFKAGDRVNTTSSLNVRGTASATGTLLGTQAMGTVGTVVSGGTSADGYYWWNVNYDTGVDGWSVENFLILSVAQPTPTPVPTPVPVPTPTPTPINTSAKFHTGDRITTGNETLNIRIQPGTTSTLVGTRPRNSLGTVVGGGIKAGEYYWWNVNYDGSEIDGWTIENYISKVTTTENGHSIPTPEAPIPTPESAPITPTPTTGGQTVITSGTDFVEFTIGSSNVYNAIGLSNADSSTSDSSVDFGFYLTKWGTFYCRSYGVSQSGCGGPFKAGDVFRVSRSGETITFIKNGENLFTGTRGAWQKAFVLPLKLDTAPSGAETAAASGSLPISNQMYMLILGALLLGGLGLMYSRKAR